MVIPRGVCFVFRAIVGVLLSLFACVAHADSLVTDGGFELPVVGPGGVDSGYENFFVGQSIDSVWTVVGASTGDVSVFPGTETSAAGGTFDVLEGLQALDLTGDTDNGAAIGVEQVIPTTAGSRYTLAFYVGNFTGLSGSDSGTARVLVELNGSAFQTASNSGHDPGAVNWQLFTDTFTATGANTALDFINGTPGGVLFNGLENVVVAPEVPEPATGVLVLCSLGSLALFSWRRIRVRTRISSSALRPTSEPVAIEDSYFC